VSSTAFRLIGSVSLRSVGHYHALPAIAVNWTVTLLLIPVSYWQYGAVGVAVVMAAAVAMQLTMTVSAWSFEAFCLAGHTLAAILSAMGIRMILPLILAILLVTFARSWVPAGAVLYIVPLYLAMLLTETLSSVRRIADDGRVSLSSGPHGPRGAERG